MLCACLCVCACRNMNRALPHKQRLLSNLSSEKSSPGEALTTLSFRLPPQNQPAGPGTRCGAGKRVGSRTLVLSVGTCGVIGGSSRHGRLPLFLLPAASFLDIIAVHVSLTAADWLDVWDQHKVTVVKCDMTAKHFRSRRKYFSPLFSLPKFVLYALNMICVFKVQLKCYDVVNWACLRVFFVNMVESSGFILKVSQLLLVTVLH